MNATYAPALLAHSWLRWIVLAMLTFQVVYALRGRAKGDPWSAVDEGIHAGTVGLLDLQVTIGLWLYLAASPLSRAFLSAPGATMHDPVIRFFGLEHITMMLLGAAVVHIGRTRSKRQADGRARHAMVLRWTLAGLVLILAGVPWPFLKAGRPLLRTSSARAVSPAVATSAEGAQFSPPQALTAISVDHQSVISTSSRVISFRLDCRNSPTARPQVDPKNPTFTEV